VILPSWWKTTLREVMVPNFHFFPQVLCDYRMEKPSQPRTTSTTITTTTVPKIPIPALLFLIPKVIPRDGPYRLYQMGVFSVTNCVHCTMRAFGMMQACQAGSEDGILARLISRHG